MIVLNHARVRRSELDSSCSSRASSVAPDTQEQLRASLARLYGDLPAQVAVIEAHPGSNKENGNSHAGPAEDPNAEGFAFHLFAKPANLGSAADEAHAQGPARIIIKEPLPEDENPGFIKPHRDRSYYFAQSWSDAKRAECAVVTFSGEDVVAEANRRWPGHELSWRIRRLRVSVKEARRLAADSMATMEGGQDDDEGARRKRKPGKKRRVVLRKREVDSKAKGERRKSEMAKAEREEREKRTRRNREKKVKKKEKERARKAVERVGMQIDDGDDGGKAAES